MIHLVKAKDYTNLCFFCNFYIPVQIDQQPLTYNTFMGFQLAIKYLKEQAKNGALNEIMKLDLLEELLSKDKLSKYIELKEKIKLFSSAHIRKFKYLYPEFLNDEISDINLDVYYKRFKPQQHIKYFNDYFDDTIENENYTSKGSNTELRAYGDSTKINRRVISFIGNFRDDLLQSFTDKTWESNNFISNTFSEIDYCSNDITLVNILIQHNALEVLSQKMLYKIALNNSNTFELLYKSKLLHFLNQEQLNEIYKKHDSVFRFLVYNNDLEIISKDTIVQIVDSHLNSIQSKLAKLKKAVSEKAYIYDPNGIFYFHSYNIESSFTDGLKAFKFNNNYGSYYSLNDIIDKLISEINSKSYYKESGSWTNKQIEIVRNKYQSTINEKINAEIESIYKISTQRIGQAKTTNIKNKIIRFITIIIIIIVIGAIMKKMYFF